MKIYKVDMDLSFVIARLKKFNLKEYSDQFPTIFVEAKDPDEACYLAYFQLVEILLKQDDSKETSLLTKDILHDILIRKVYVPE
tara:strand:- start:3557 stop:3808 length:252 start_codon:yes stop_codon:yes gene_type:complete